MRTVKEIFEGMPAAFDKSKAVGMNATFQFNITGEGGGKWFAEVKNGELTFGEGEKPNPDTVLTASGPDYLAIAEGKLNPMLAFATGKVKLSNIAMGMKLQSIFKR